MCSQNSQKQYGRCWCCHVVYLNIVIYNNKSLLIQTFAWSSFIMLITHKDFYHVIWKRFEIFSKKISHHERHVRGVSWVSNVNFILFQIKFFLCSIAQIFHENWSTKKKRIREEKKCSLVLFFVAFCPFFHRLDLAEKF